MSSTVGRLFEITSLLRYVRVVEPLSVKVVISTAVADHCRAACHNDVGIQICESFKTSLITSIKLNLASCLRIDGKRYTNNFKQEIIYQNSERTVYCSALCLGGRLITFILPKCSAKAWDENQLFWKNLERSEDREGRKSNDFLDKMSANSNISVISKMTWCGQYGMNSEDK